MHSALFNWEQITEEQSKKEQRFLIEYHFRFPFFFFFIP